MSGCQPIEMPVCEHHVPIKFGCDRCRHKALERRIEGLELKLNKFMVFAKVNECSFCRGNGKFLMPSKSNFNEPVEAIENECNYCFGKGLVWY